MTTGSCEIRASDAVPTFRRRNFAAFLTAARRFRTPWRRKAAASAAAWARSRAWSSLGDMAASLRDELDETIHVERLLDATLDAVPGDAVQHLARGAGREDDHAHVGVVAPDVLDHLRAVDAGHDEVRDADVDLAAPELLE